ncbi:EAL and HDOD domain-containing protein [Butyrivibrio sp. MC2013]|uniref:EAL and HDOD domain-containing protein n=1 Tax=Butyrivibrio sp. MC2013 TaxID=1280686 RepID=UPI000417D314|nr:HDOD domain-containing protein [Butyrivibrio sp. MC2013]
MLATLIPLFDDKMEVKAYSILAKRENTLVNPRYQGTASLDGAGEVDGFEVVNSIGMDALASDSELFIEVNNISVFADIPSLCEGDHSRQVLIIDSYVTPEDIYVNRLKELKADGYKLAMKKLSPAQFENYKTVLDLCDYILLDHNKIDIVKAHLYFSHMYPDIKLIAVNVNSKEDYDKLVSEKSGYDFYEGEFFRMPITSSDTEVAPLKATYIQLLNVVNDPDFELTQAADVIGQDTALVISLLEMVNRITVSSNISSVRQAAALLGQKELKKWITTAVTRELCADRPSEIARLSMIRARFAENLAPSFGMGVASSELFLMGLFSVLNLILDKPMEEALKLVNVTKDIENALLNRNGKLYPVLDFITNYETASWQEVFRQIIVGELDMDEVYKAYLDALVWYRKLVAPANK